MLHCSILLYNIQLQYLEIKGDVCHDQYRKVNLMFLSIYFFQVDLNICFFKSLLLADQMTQNLFKLAQKNQQDAELKQIIFFFNDNRALDFYCLKAGKIQQQEGWMGIVWFYGVVIHWLLEQKLSFYVEF